MRHLLRCLFLAFLIPCFANAQDTIHVQTFDWDSDTRSDLFQFPDDPAESYRKIWMSYNIRCHDNAVGSGAVGCREWDYSCNTFLYDPNRVDSTRQVAPTHVISNFSGDVFEYTTQTVYDYTQYEQHEPLVTYTNEFLASIGDGFAPLELSGTQPVGRAQFLYTAAELTDIGMTAGPIHALSLVPAADGEVDFFRLRLKASNQVELDPQNPELEGFTEVVFQNIAFAGTAPQQIDFYQPFEWDGVSSIIVEMSFTQEPDGNSPSIRVHDTGFNSMIASGENDFSLGFSGAGQVDVPGEKFETVSDQIHHFIMVLWRCEPAHQHYPF